ncbi:hypothetical protein IJ913_00830 [bacterium]|nr:hypothetical protein [bacterium]
MKKTSIAMCAVLFGALVVSNAFASDAETGAAVTTEVSTGTVVEATTTAAETTTGAAATGTVAEATTGNVTTGAVATGAVESTTGVVATGAAEATTGEAEKSINDALHAILDKFFENNASKFNTAKDKNDCLETVKANINKAAETAKEAQKEAYAIIKEALETYKIK